MKWKVTRICEALYVTFCKYTEIIANASAVIISIMAHYTERLITAWCSDLAAWFLFVTKHDNNLTSLIVHHLPEICKRCRQRWLCCYEVWRAGRQVLQYTQQTSYRHVYSGVTVGQLVYFDVSCFMSSRRVFLYTFCVYSCASEVIRHAGAIQIRLLLYYYYY